MTFTIAKPVTSGSGNHRSEVLCSSSRSCGSPTWRRVLPKPKRRRRWQRARRPKFRLHRRKPTRWPLPEHRRASASLLASQGHLSRRRAGHITPLAPRVLAKSSRPIRIALPQKIHHRASSRASAVTFSSRKKRHGLIMRHNAVDSILAAVARALY
jgi:hypothetical protein